MAKGESKSTDLTIIDEIRSNAIAKQDTHKVPLSKVFGRGLSEKKESFAGRTLAENAELVDMAMQNMDGLHNIWNHSHTQWVWKHITCSWLSPHANLKQVAAEMQRKRAALNEAKWRQVKNEVKIRKLEEKLTDDVDYWIEVDSKIKIAELKEGLEEGNRLIEGALKDVLILNQVYEELKELVDSFTEEELELQESKSHLKRSLMQSLRDVRQYGVVTKGEQEYMEQIGCNPSKVQNLLRAFIQRENEENSSWNNVDMLKFIDELVDKLIDEEKVDIERLKAVGFLSDVIPGMGWHGKVAEKGRDGT